MKVLIGYNERGRRIGQFHERAKLTDADVETIRALREADPAFWSFSKLALKFDVTKRHIKRLCDYEDRAEAPARYRAVSLS